MARTFCAVAVDAGGGCYNIFIGVGRILGGQGLEYWGEGGGEFQAGT